MERSKKSCLTMLMATHIVVNKSRSCLLKLSLSLELEGRLEMVQRASKSTAAIRVRYLHKTESSQENLVMFDWLLFLRKTKTDEEGRKMCYFLFSSRSRCYQLNKNAWRWGTQ